MSGIYASRDEQRLDWFATTAAAAEDGSGWNETMLDVVREKFNVYRAEGAQPLDAFKRAIDTQLPSVEDSEIAGCGNQPFHSSEKP